MGILFGIRPQRIQLPSTKSSKGFSWENHMRIRSHANDQVSRIPEFNSAEFLDSWVVGSMIATLQSRQADVSIYTAIISAPDF